jgi:predicted CXXCH cytochrome family protein
MASLESLFAFRRRVPPLRDPKRRARGASRDDPLVLWDAGLEHADRTGRSDPSSVRGRSWRRFTTLVVALVLWATAAPAAPDAGAPGEPARAAEPALAPAETGDAGATRADGGKPRLLPEEEPNTCAACHATLPEEQLSKPAKQFRASVHRDDRIGCAGCHKGDPKNPTVAAHDPSAGFLPRPKHEDVSKVCGGCHQDVAFIRRFRGDLATDLKVQYDGSLHGRLANAGDPGAPTCTSCHGAHDIQPRKSLESPVHRRNIPTLCGKCHNDPEHMKGRKIPTNQLSAWERSRHAAAFYAGNPNAPNCIGCHGPHASMPPVASTAGRVCGHCHEDELEMFRLSPHTRPFQRLGLAECTPCHDNHDVVRTTWLAGFSADSACGRCHAKDEKPHDIISAIAATLRRTSERAEKAKARVAAARAAGLLVAPATMPLADIESARQKLRTLVHSLDPKRLEDSAKNIDASADQVEAVVAAAERTRLLRRRGYYFALVTALLLLGLLVAKALLLEHRRRQSGA